MDAVSHAADLLRQGKLIGLPTETVYGLAADASNPEAIRRIFTVKGRPPSHPLIVHLADPTHASAWAALVPESALQLMERFWPGPLTLVLPARQDVPAEITGGQDSIALRMPNHSVALSVLRQFGGALVAPSANRFGHVSPTCAQHVRDSLGSAVDYVLDGGSCRYGLESTIVSLLQDRPQILRPGALSLRELESVLGAGQITLPAGDSTPRVPGSHLSHYAPRTPVYVIPADQLATYAHTALNARRQVGVLKRCDTVLERSPSSALLQFCMPATPQLYGRELYTRLREIDRLGLDLLLVESVPVHPDWLAVQDRLERASGKLDTLTAELLAA